MNTILLFIFFVCGVSSAEYSYKDLRCLVCRETIREMTKAIDKVNPNKKIQVGGYRLDNTGKVEEKLVPFARSGMHLSELMDEICQTMENYVKATDKKTGKLVLLKLMTESGAMNPLISDVDIIQDPDLNKNLGFYCEGFVEEFEDEIYNELKEPSSDSISAICTKATELCDSSEKDEL